MSDLIDRQRAIEAVELGITYAKLIDTETGELLEPFKASNDELKRAVQRIKNLPSAQPTFDARDTQYNLPIGTDLISRKQAIEVVQNRHFTLSKEKVLLINDLEKLPPALGTNLAEVGTDLISRQQAINALDECYCGGEDSCGEPWVYKENAVEAIQMIKPILPAEQKRGKWILDRSGAYCCSECMEPCAGYVMMKPRDKFCKMCGSRNEVTE